MDKKPEYHSALLFHQLFPRFFFDRGKSHSKDRKEVSEDDISSNPGDIAIKLGRDVDPNAGDVEKCKWA